MELYLDQERTRPFLGPLFQQEANPAAGYYLDQGLMTSVNLVCIESTGISKVKATAPLPSSTPLHATASIVVNKNFSKDQTLFLIDLMRLQMEEQGKGPPKSLQDLNQRLRLARKSKKLLWEDIAGKLTTHFAQTFAHDKVARKWNTLVEAYKKVKDNNSSTGRGPSKFQFYAEMDDLLGGHHDIDFPVVGTAMGLDVRRPDALQVSVSAPDISPAPSPSPSCPPSPPPSSSIATPTVTTLPQDTPKRPRKRQREDDLLEFLRESEAASQVASQKRHAETLAQMKESQEGFQRLLAQMVEKM
ncbi:hypothetical protein UPYG_G00164730 [Umbra pygmaea]|uniref:Myb/SANT-like DNA-binding domain-containing protein n=1 Tax=Umbra pygmaea TaxID=75934 RepID=A0ABD0WSD2_UMBPY